MAKKAETDDALRIESKTETVAETKPIIAAEPQTPTQRPTPTPRKLALRSSHVVVGLVVIAALGIGFAAGQHFDNNRRLLPAANRMAIGGDQSSGTGGRGGFGGRNGAMRGGVIGQVTAISATSITVQNTRTSTDSTLTISSSTTVTNNGQTAAISDIKTGDTVLVRTSGTDSKQATQIALNPPMRVGQGAPGGMSNQGDAPQTPVQTN